MKKIFHSVFLFLICISFANAQVATKKLLIAISKTTEESAYVKWLKRSKPDVLLINMYNLPFDSIEPVLSRCGGLLLTGGSDVVPAIYGKGKEVKKCEEFDVRRDSLELKLIRSALNKKMPVLGICRGEQILNVAMGGTLFTDIPTDIGKQVSHRNDTMAYHHVIVKEGTLLYKICGVKEGIVNSAHHQCVDKISTRFIVSANADDGVVEAYELKDPKSYPFMLGVQWHPERLDSKNPLSYLIADYFLKKSLEFVKVN